MLASYPHLQRWLIRITGLVGVLFAVVLIGIMAATGPVGRWTVMQFADDRELPRGLLLELDGLSGNVLHRATLGHVRISDSEGLFLIIENFSVDWNSLALLRGNLDVEAVGASRIEWLRQPVLVPATGGGATLPDVRIGSVNIAELALHEDVLGEAATFSAQGRVRLRGGGQIFAEVIRTDRAGDRLEGTVNWSSRGALDGELDAFISGEGPLGSVLRLNGRDAHLSGHVTGSVEQGNGSAVLTIAGQEAMTGGFDWQDSRWSMQAETDGRLLSSIRSLPISLEARLQASGDLENRWPDTVEATGAGWQVLARPLGAGRVEAQIMFGETIWSAFTNDQASASNTRWSGTIDLNSGISADGILEMQAISVPGLGVEALGGALLFTRHDGQNSVFADLTASTLTLPDASPIASLAWMSLAFEARQRDGVYQVTALDLDSEAIALSGDVNLDPRDWVATAEANLRIHDASALTDEASGPAAADLHVTEVSREGLRLDLAIDGSSLQWTRSPLQTLLPNVRLTSGLETNYTDWQATDIRLTSEGALVQGRADGTGPNWTTALDIAVSGDVAIANAIIGGGAAIAIEANGEGASASGNAVLSTPHFTVSNRDFLQPRLGLTFDASRARQHADWQLESGTEYGPLIALGEVVRTTSSTSLIVENGQLGSFGFTAGASMAENDTRARLTGRDWQIDQGEISSFELTVAGNDVGTRFTASSSGTIRDPYTLSATATLTDERISARLTGDWAGIPIETIDPLVYRFADGLPEFHGQLATGGGIIRLRWTAENRLRVTVTDLPADILATAGNLPALEGEVGFNLFLSQRDGFWTGDINAQAQQLRIRQYRMGSAVDLALEGQLGESGLGVSLDVRSDGLSGNARLDRTGQISQLGQLRSDAPLNGSISVVGAIEPVVALVLGDARQLAGDLALNLDIAGSTHSPRLSGTTELENGHFISEELGLRITDVNALANWSNGVLQVQRFSAQDGIGGELVGTGSGRFTEAGWQAETQLEFSGFKAVQRPDLGITTTGNADITLDAQGIRIAGQATLDRVDARPPEASAPTFAEIEVTEINRPDGENGQRRRRIPVTLDYRVRADDSIFVSAESFSTEWRGAWHVTGNPSSPTIRGDAHLIYGRAILLNRAFRLDEGRVSLNGDLRTAEIDLLARHQRDSLTVLARVEGPVSSPDLNLSSQPALPQDEILARLLFDRNSGQLSPLETATIAAQLSGRNLFGIVSGLRRAAGLDRLDFATTENGEIRVTGGEQLTDDVYLELESRGAALSSARLEWTLTPDISLLSRLTGDTQASIALRWRTEY